MGRTQNKQSGFGAVVILLVILVVGAIAIGGLLVYQHHKSTSKTTAQTGTSQNTGQQQGTTNTQPTPAVTYTSNSEKASFQYPNNWTVTKPSMTSSDTSNTDQIGIISPSGTIKISWVTDLVGFGNEYGSSYPYHTIIDKTPITGAPGLYVVSGITTLDGTTYYPWIAVQDSSGILTSGVNGTLITFKNRRALNPSTNGVTRSLFSTSGAKVDQNSPALTKAQATAWFSGSEAQQAKQILLSFSDPQ